MSAAPLVLALAMAWAHPSIAPCARTVRVGPVASDGSVLADLALTAPRSSGPWEIFAPSGSRAAFAYRPTLGGRERVTFEDEIPNDGHVLYSGPPALTIPNAWARRPFFVRIFSKAGARGCIRAAPLSFVLHNESRHVPLYLYFGLLGGTALTMLVLFAMSGEPFIGWYLAYLGSLILYQLFRNNFLWQLGWPFGPWHSGEIEYVLWGPNIALYAQFARSFLQTARYAPRIDRLLILGIAVLLAYIPVVVFVRHFTGLNLNPQSSIPIASMLWVSVLVIVATIHRARAGYRPARYFLLSYPILLIFVCIAVWQYTVGVHAGIGIYGAEIGTGSECVLLAFAIGDRLCIERTLGRVLSNIDAIIVRLGRDGSVLFATANIESLLGVSNEELVGKRIADVLGACHAELVTKLARTAIRTNPNAVAKLEIDLSNHLGEMKTFAATLHVERERSGAIAEIQVALHPSIPTRAPMQAVYLSVYRGLLLLDASAIALTGREIELLAYLALHRTPIPSSQLATAIWPDRDARAAASALQTTISRLRKKLPPGTLLATQRQYALGTTVHSDLDELRAALREGAIEELQRLRPLVTAAIPSTLRHREWFADFDLWLESLRRDALLQLGEALVTRGELSAPLSIADDLRRLDPSDESGYLLAIRALLAANDPAAARRVYADCRRALDRALGLTPSPQFEQFCRSFSETA
ncbi:MAG: PAS domain-containing protein [Candidatus Eremiobacteraeota bacterium]|uniref:PAS domain-containing protein n=1 Tax=mine drainage metagenome TaxID=410659 RepID=E6PEI0_9ZZZZ|nr:PAS domain-containing protein [Candidatus Eremiobacteraeota bacterium]